MEPETNSSLMGEVKKQCSVHEARMKSCTYVHFPYMDEVFISATDNVVVGDSDGVYAAPTGLQDVNTLQRADVPNLKDTQRGSERGVKSEKGREKNRRQK